MKLSEWAAQQGIHYQTAWRWWNRGILPVPARQLASGTILVDVPASPAGTAGRTVIYARVSAHDRRSDLDRQVSRIVAWASRQQLAVDQVVTEVGSGPSGRRPKLARLLVDPQVTTIVVERRDRLGPLWGRAGPSGAFRSWPAGAGRGCGRGHRRVGR